MPWKELSVMDAKLLFIGDCLRGEEAMTVLCERYGISRETGYVWKRRYLSEGAAGLVERSHAPHRHGRSTPAELVVRIIDARRQRPHWGPKKLLALLRRESPQTVWPAPSTVSQILHREGLSQSRRFRRRPLTMEQPFAAVEAANDAWCIDFKGWFRTGDGERCDPLTVTDAFSRYILGLKILEPTIAEVEPAMDRLFREYGLPLSIRSDNGSPFASSGAGGLTRLSARWARMGIGLERIYPGKPQQNGRHERMHATLKGETCAPPCANCREQQDRFDEFRRDFNEVRPHEALGQLVPGQFYSPSPRPYREHPDEPAYGPDEAVRKVRLNGEIKWRGSMVFLSTALVGEAVGIREREDGHWFVRFADVPLALIDRYSGKLTPFGAGRPPCPKRTTST
jgi:transposase InsO family protein